MNNQSPETLNEDGAEAQAAGDWLLNLFQEEKDARRTLTTIERRRLEQYCEKYRNDDSFQRCQLETLKKCLHHQGYRMAQALLAQGMQPQQLKLVPTVLQIAIKAARLQPGHLGKSPALSCPELLDTVKLLVSLGSLINSLDEDGNSAIFYSCVLGYPELTVYLHESGAHISTTDHQKPPAQLEQRNWGTPCGDDPSEVNHSDCRKGVNLLQVTLDACLTPHTVTDSTWVGYPPGLDYDAALWQLDVEASWGGVVLYLLEIGLYCEPDNPGFVNLLHICCYQGKENLISRFIACGASINSSGAATLDETGHNQGCFYGTALHAAAGRCQIAAAEILIHHGADPRLGRYCQLRDESNSDFTAVQVALYFAQSTEEDEDIQSAIDFCRVLMDSDHGVNNDDLEELIEFGARTGRTDFLVELLDRGIKPSTMLDTRSLDVVLLLSKYGVPVDHATIQHKAVKSRSAPLLRWSVGQHRGLLPSDQERWGFMLSQLVALRGDEATLGLIEYLFCQYPGPHINTVLYVPPHRPDSSAAPPGLLRTNALQIALHRKSRNIVKLALQAGADPSCPSLPEDAMAAFQRIIRTSNITADINNCLSIIRLLQAPRFCATNWTVPSLEESRAEARSNIYRQQTAWRVRVNNLIQQRRDPPVTEAYPQSDAVANSVEVLKTFPYRPLSSSSSLRILELLPSEDSEAPLVGHLKHSDLPNLPKFEALSYTWGDLNMNKSLLLDDIPVPTSNNLQSALIHLRDKVETRRLWVDALCINQADSQERSQQVKIMGDIYRAASNVIIWLGESANNSELVFARVNNLELSKRPPSPKEIHAWEDLVMRPWFFRTWVMQELGLSKNALVMCGDDTAPWRDLGGIKGDISGGASGLCEVVRSNHRGNTYHPLKGVNITRHIYNLRVLKTGSRTEEIMISSRLCSTSDKRDQIYGILGFFEPGFMPVDYTLPFETVYRQFATCSIQKEQTLSMLQGSRIRRSSEALPSWVPDFSLSAPACNLPSPYVSDTEARRGEYSLRRADGTVTLFSKVGFPAKILPGLEFPNDGALVVCGKLVDEVKVVTPALPLTEPPLSRLYTEKGLESQGEKGASNFAQVFRQWELLASSLVPAWKDDVRSITDAFATTLIANCGKRITRSKSQPQEFSPHAEGFALWYRFCGTGVLEEADPRGYLRDVEFFMNWAGTESTDLKRSSGAQYEQLSSKFKNYAEEVEETSYDRSFFVTKGGSMGLAALGTRDGDRIAFIPGSQQPLVLRPRVSCGWELVGDCYLDDLDIFRLFEDDQQLVEDFVIY